MSPLELRMNKMERKLHLYQIAFISILLIAVLFMISSFKKNVAPDVIQAKEFQVVDDQGNVYVSLKVVNKAGDIRLNNSAGSDIVHMMKSDGGNGVLFTRTNNGNLGCRLSAYATGGGSIEVYNSKNVVADAIGSTASDFGYIGINHATTGNNLLNISSTINGDGVVSVFNRNKQRICILGPDDVGNGLVNVFDKNGQNQNSITNK